MLTLPAQDPDLVLLDDHEAAVGKIDLRDIASLVAGGLDEEQAVSTIVRGFFNVDINGLPESLKSKLDKAILETQKDMIKGRGKYGEGCLLRNIVC